MRPGRAAITSTRLARYTDSKTEWVTKMIVVRKASHSLQEIVVELKARDLVERGKRFVHQQNLRLGDERARDGDAHAHAAG